MTEVLTFFVVLLIVLLLAFFLSLARWSYKKSKRKAELEAMKTRQQEEAEGALPIDPTNPPYFLTFNPKPGYQRNCSCHDVPLSPGDTVLFFPLADGSVVVFCADGVRENLSKT